LVATATLDEACEEEAMIPDPRKLSSLAGAFYEELGTAVAGNGWPECCGETMLLTAHGEVGG
jgi:hypothetical protein